MTTTLVATLPHGASNFPLPPFACKHAQFTLDTAYPNSGSNTGYILSVSGLRLIREFLIYSNNSGFKVEWDPAAGANGRLRVYRTAAQGTTSRVKTYAPGGGDIKGSANTDVGIASGTLPTNGALLSNLATAANTTTVSSFDATVDVGRNVCIAMKNTNAGASTGNAVSCLVTGTWRGAAQTETISFTALELTSTAQNEVATKYGSKPFDTVTSVTFPVAQPANWQHGIGVGSKLGLPTDLFTPAEADVIKITKTAANLANTGIVDTTNMTVNLGALSNGDDVGIEYLETVDAADSAAAMTEVANGVSLSTVVVRGIAMGSASNT